MEAHIALHLTDFTNLLCIECLVMLHRPWLTTVLPKVEVEVELECAIKYKYIEYSIM